jgi:hypothetical protein
MATSAASAARSSGATPAHHHCRSPPPAVRVEVERGDHRHRGRRAHRGRAARARRRPPPVRRPPCPRPPRPPVRWRPARRARQGRAVRPPAPRSATRIATTRAPRRVGDAGALLGDVQPARSSARSPATSSPASRSRAATRHRLHRSPSSAWATSSTSAAVKRRGRFGSAPAREPNRRLCERLQLLGNVAGEHPSTRAPEPRPALAPRGRQLAPHVTRPRARRSQRWARDDGSASATAGR